MNKRNDMIVEWAIRRVEEEYRDDVSLLITYGSYENGTANPLSDVDFYFIPKTDRAYSLCKTFIVEGIGFDLFPMSWERVEGLADFKESLTPLLANVKVLYCNSDEDKARFEALQAKVQANLGNKAFMLEKALEKLKAAKALYGSMLFEDGLSETRAFAGYIAMDLSDAVAYGNQTYFSRGLKKQLEDLKQMTSLPDDFIKLFEAIVAAQSRPELREICHRMIDNTKRHLDRMSDMSSKESRQVDCRGLAEFYQEGISTWNKIYVCCDNDNASLAYISGTCLQHELDRVAEENGLDRFDLMGAFDAGDLAQFRERALQIQARFEHVIKDNGGVIEAYDTAQQFFEAMGARG